MDKRFEEIAWLALVFMLVVGCYLVLKPFLAAMLLAAVMCVSTWPFYLWILRKMKGRRNLASFSMTLLLTLVVILPLTLVAYNLTDSFTMLYEGIRREAEHGTLNSPEWLKAVPLVGSYADEYWNLIVSSREEMFALMGDLLEPARNLLVSGGMLLGRGVLELAMSAFISFFFYRDGLSLVRFVHTAMRKVTGESAGNVIKIINTTVQAVVYGMLGTSLAQGLLATIGFAIAGVPMALLLGLLTALLSPVPVGPPLVWMSAAAWLFYHDAFGWGVFMVLWGLLVVSSVDNILKPILISRNSNLPFVLGLIGVMGGVLAFGFVGIFIGPTLLAVGYSLIQDWVSPAPVD